MIEQMRRRAQAWIRHTQKQRLEWRRIESESGLSHRLLYKAIREGWDPHASTLSKIEPLIPDDFMPLDCKAPTDCAA